MLSMRKLAQEEGDSSSPVSLKGLARKSGFSSIKQLGASLTIDQHFALLGGFKGSLGVNTSGLTQMAPRQFQKSYRGGNLLLNLDDDQISLTDGLQLRITYEGIHCFGNPGGVANADAYAIISLFANEQAVIKVFKVPEDGTDDLYKNFEGGQESTQGQITVSPGSPLLPPQTLTISTSVFHVGILGQDVAKTKDAFSVALGGVAASFAAASGAVILAPVALEIGEAVGNALFNAFGLSDVLINNVSHPFLNVAEITALPPANSLVEGTIKHNFPTAIISNGDASYKMYFNIEVLPVGAALHT